MESLGNLIRFLKEFTFNSHQNNTSFILLRCVLQNVKAKLGTNGKNVIRFLGVNIKFLCFLFLKYSVDSFI